MLLSALVLSAASLNPATQATNAVVATDFPASNPSAAQADIDAGLAAFKRRRFTQAEASFQKAMNADPGSAAPYFYLAYTYYKQAEPKRPFHPDKQKSKEMFAKAYAIDPAFRPVWGEPKAAKK